ncbi:MAG: metallophosphoesterase [Defluviitaleaceae bacterium]|nr:metallophosphoesterase [Defluviitaleaceae bacterium]
MKILVLSDSHGITGLMADVVAKHANDMACVLFLGDYERDCDEISQKFSNLVFYVVPGNCDFSSDLPEELTLEMGGKKIWMTHGHYYGVKSGHERVQAAAEARGVDVCLYGHSHVAETFNKNGILFLNPGSISEPRGYGGKSYAVLEILGDVVLSKIIEVKG